MNAKDTPVARLRYTVEDAAFALSVSRSHLLTMIRTDRIASYKDGKRIFISASALNGYLESVEQQAKRDGRPAA